MSFFKENLLGGDGGAKIPKPDRERKKEKSWLWERFNKIREGGENAGQAEIAEIKKITDKLPDNPEARALSEEVEVVVKACNQELRAEEVKRAKEIKVAIGGDEQQENNTENIPVPEGWGECSDFEVGANQPEKIEKTEEQELREGIARLDKYIELSVSELQEQGLPIGKDYRIDMDKYEDVVGNLNKDKEYVQKREAEFAQEGDKKGIKKGDIILGEQMERFSTALLYKIFKELDTGHIAAQTSRCDDIGNKIDSFIFNKKNGKTIGTFDAVVNKEGMKRFEEKRKYTFNKNFQDGGGNLDYALDVDENGEIIKAKRDKIPVACLNLPAERFKVILKEVDLLQKGLTEKEKELGIEFLTSIREQFEYFENSKNSEQYKEAVQELNKIIGLIAYKESEKPQSNIKELGGGNWTWKE